MWLDGAANAERFTETVSSTVAADSGHSAVKAFFASPDCGNGPFCCDSLEKPGLVEGTYMYGRLVRMTDRRRVVRAFCVCTPICGSPIKRISCRLSYFGHWPSGVNAVPSGPGSWARAIRRRPVRTVLHSRKASMRHDRPPSSPCCGSGTDGIGISVFSWCTKRLAGRAGWMGLFVRCSLKPWDCSKACGGNTF